MSSQPTNITNTHTPHHTHTPLLESAVYIAIYVRWKKESYI